MVARTPTSRRQFLKTAARTAGLLGAAVAFPTIIPARVFGANAPSNRIALGLIGLGGMGVGNLRGFLQLRAARVVAVCDVDKQRLSLGKKFVDREYEDKSCRTHTDFRELIGHGDLDAVCISTPDNWHAICGLMALRAGLDVYGEKPLTHDVRSGRVLCATAQRLARVWQTGSQQRSSADFRRACELVRNGRLGRVHTVEIGLPEGKTFEDPPVQPVPPELNWELWLGPAPWRPYQGVCHYSWRFVYDWGGGKIMDWIGHHGDIAHWGLGLDHTGPVEVAGKGDFPDEGLFNTPPTYRVTCKYATGVEMIVANKDQVPKGMGVRWIGDNGWLWITRGDMDAEPKSLLRETISASEVQLYRSREHRQNFLDCVRTRRPTAAPPEVAQRAATVGHLGNIAMRTGRKLRWNPDTEEIIGDAGAAAMLGRACREPWKL